MMRKSNTNQLRSANRRVSTLRQRRQQHLLDVKVRARRASHHRNRRILVALSKIALVLALVAGIYFGTRAGMKRFFFDNPEYALATIVIRTDGTLQRDQVLKTAQLREGINIFSVNLAQVHDRLQRLAQVDEVQVERKLPNEIDLQITERKPIAWITSEKTLADPFASDVAFLIDARGIVMKEKKLLPEYLALPVITGCANDALTPGKTVDSFEAKSALELLRLTTTSFMQTRFQIREVDVSNGYCLVVSDKNHTEAMFDFEHLEEQMQRFEQLLVYCDDSQRQIATVNLLVARNIPVTFAQPASEVISELDPEPLPETDLAKGEAKEEKAVEPEIRKAKPGSTPLPIKRALPYSPGVKKFHATPTPMPVRKAVPLQRFKQENNLNG
jgi:cell division septal protein FtsQ